MSAAHTPGRLAVAVEIFDNDGMPETALQALGGAATVAVALEFGPNNPGMREANARRIVACWNACEGLSTEALERLGTIDRARVELDVIRAQAIAQRDELLAALRVAVRQNSHDMLMTGEELRAAEAAIAKATGQEGGAA